MEEKEELGNYQPVSTLSTLRKKLKQLVQQIISEHFEDQKELRSTKHMLFKNKL